MSPTARSVVVSSDFARSTRSCWIIEYGERPSEFWKRRSSTRRDTPILAAHSSTEAIVEICSTRDCIARRTTGSPTASYELDPRATISKGGTRTGETGGFPAQIASIICTASAASRRHGRRMLDSAGRAISQTVSSSLAEITPTPNGTSSPACAAASKTCRPVGSCAVKIPTGIASPDSQPTMSSSGSRQYSSYCRRSRNSSQKTDTSPTTARKPSSRCLA